ncbi:MAG TPA: tRNA pseudouridine(38-40) synthase TruA [Flavisolibacter sp.]
MSRYFIEVAYRGTRYSGFQVQENSVTIQSELEKAFAVLHRHPVALTGSSRTDAGVHALQNYFHFDADQVHPQFVYKMNAILPPDISVKRIVLMHDEAHSRFDAVSREYVYRFHKFKDPFAEGLSLYFPYRVRVDLMEEAATIIAGETNFFAFAKTNSQAKHYQCRVVNSSFADAGDSMLFVIEANRFLRGMVRLLTGALVRVGREQMTLETFRSLFSGTEKCGYAVPARGLYLKAVKFPENYFP